MKRVDFINKKNLKIARENVGMSTLVVSKKFTRSNKDLVLSWENGKILPTWRQVIKLAKIYNIPELVLLSDRLINKNKIIPDYRIVKGIENSGKIKKLINFIIRRQGWLEQNLRSNDHKNTLQGSGKNIKDPQKLALFIKEKLAIDLEKIKKMSGSNSRKKALKYLITKAEEKGIFIAKTISYHRIEVAEMRGLFIANDYYPFIVLNRKDALAAQLFSIVHEFAHLFRKTEAISNSLEFRKINNNLAKEEIFCNKVAVNLFLPPEEFSQEYYNKMEIAELSKIYKLSSLAIFYRLKDLNKIPQANINEIEKQIKDESKNFIKQKKIKKQKGGNYFYSMRDSNGDLFNKTVAKYYYENIIGYTEASNMLLFPVENI